MAWIVAFNSFKGGSGRSTTCLNVAWQLAHREKRLLLVDLDLHGPGLGTLLDRPENETARRGILSYLASPPVYEEVPAADAAGAGAEDDGTTSPSQVELPVPIEDHIVTIESHGVTFDFMGAPVSEDAAVAKLDPDRVAERILSLAEQVADRYDFVLIDAASGTSDYAVLAFTIANTAALCFRWSRQHLTGTLRTLRLLCDIMDRGDFPLVDFTLVANAVPAPSNRREREIVAEVHSAISDQLRLRWGGDLMPNGRPMPEPQRIPEMLAMKFWEEIVEQDDQAVTYDQLADYLIKRSEF